MQHREIQWHNFVFPIYLWIRLLFLISDGVGLVHNALLKCVYLQPAGNLTCITLAYLWWRIHLLDQNWVDCIKIDLESIIESESFDFLF